MRQEQPTLICKQLAAPPLYQYTYDELSSATKGFTSRVIRDDARGTVYQGCIVSTGLDVAVLVLKPQDGIVPDFKDEVEELAKRRHKHLISLDGYYKDGGKGILVFDRIVNATSVHDSLHNRERGLNPPVWKERVHVALYVSQALRFLHRKGLVYGHVAASNVLLSTFRDQIKLADLRYLGEAGHGDESGYHAPEYTPGDQTKEAEVYSFGVLLLELVTGQKPYDENRGDGKPAKLVEAVR